MTIRLRAAFYMKRCIARSAMPNGAVIATLPFGMSPLQCECLLLTQSGHVTDKRSVDVF